VDPLHGGGTGRSASGKAVVLGAHYAALSVVRALTREGIHVLVVASDSHDHACHSRFVSDLIVAPSPTDHGDGLLAALLDVGEDWAGALLIPTLDEYVIWVSRNRAKLSEKFVFAVPGPDVIDRIIDKSLHYAVARGAGVPIPEYLVPDSVELLDQWRDASHFPCIVKPFESRRFSEIYRAKVLVARDFTELTEQYADASARGLDVMVCEVIPGDDCSIFSYHSYIDSGGEVLAELCTQKLRQYPSGFGQGAIVRTVPLIPELRDLALKVLTASGYFGESSTEFRLDHRDGLYKLMEVDARPNVYEWLFVEAGVNLPYITYRDVVEGVRTTPQSYDTDLHWIHDHWELVNLVRYLKAGHLDLKAFFAPYGRRRVSAVPFFGDPVHFLREMYRHRGRALARIRDRASS
jgi:D-aspartate ligase